MTVNIDNMLGELTARERDALAALFRGMASKSLSIETTGNLELQVSADDAYQFLLMDLETSWEPTTTVVAQAIASLQQYISGVLSGIEPGYRGIDWTTSGSLAPALKYWDEFASQYDTWAAQSMLQTYPENYLVPTLRPAQTQPFEKLVSRINQGEVNDNTTLASIQQYLNDFEEVANLTVISGYVDGLEAATPALTDGYINEELGGIGKTLYLGRTSSTPPTYYWRQCNLWLDDASGYPAPNAWTEWEKIDTAFNDEVLVGIPRLLQYNERTFVTWFERQITSVQDDNTSTANMVTITAYSAYRKFDGTWNAPQVLSKYSGACVQFQNNPNIAESLFAYDPKNPDKEPAWSTAAFQLADSSGTEYLYTLLFTNQPGLDGKSLPPRGTLFVCQVDAWMKVAASTDSSGIAVQLSEAVDTFNGASKIPNAGLLSAQDLTGQQLLQTLVSLNADASHSRALMLDVREVIQDDDKTLTLNRPLPEMRAKTNLRNGAGTAAYEPNTIFYKPPSDSNPGMAYLCFKPGITASVSAGKQEVLYNFNNEYIHGWYKVYLDTWTAEMYIAVQDGNSSFTLTKPGRADSPDRESNAYPMLGCSGGYIGTFNGHAQAYWAYFTYNRTISYSATEMHVVLQSNMAWLNRNPPASVRGENVKFNYSVPAIFFDRTIPNANFGLTGYTSSKDYTGPYPVECKPIVDLSVEAGPEGTFFLSLASSPTSEWPGEDKLTILKEEQFQTLAATSLVECTENSIAADKHYKIDHLYTGVKYQSKDGLVQSAWRRAFWSPVYPWSLDSLTIPAIDTNTSSDMGTAELLNPRGRKQLRDQSTNAPNVRLNTLFTSTLINDANLGLNTLYQWDTQLTPEPNVDKATGDPQPMDFHGANSLYFWELFYHTPALTAYTLQSQAQYAEALKWQRRIFDPRAQVALEEGEDPLNPIPNFWKVRPIAPETSSKSTYALTTSMLTDPYAVSYRDPVHFRAAAYMDYIALYIAIGDQYYRMLTPDSLNQALQYYTGAHNILGERPYQARAVNWTGSVPLGTFSSNQPVNPKLAAFEMNVQDAAQWQLRPYISDAARVSPAFAKYFSPPINQKLMGLWDTIDARRENLRHSLDIGGNPIVLPPYASPLNPEALIRRPARNGTLNGSVAGTLRIIPPYRYSVISALAQKAVGTLIGFGQQLLGYRGNIDGRQQELLQQSQLLDLWSFTKTANKQAIDIANGSLQSLKLSLGSAQDRERYYQELVATGLSPLERSAMTQTQDGQKSMLAADVLNKSGAAADLAPNVFGLATGGMHYGALLYAASGALTLHGQITLNRAGETSTMASYRRRQDDWEFQLKQTRQEVANLQQQISTQQIQIDAARNSQALSETQHLQSMEMYSFLSKRYTNEALHQWLAGQMAALYRQAYDAAVSLCLLAQTCWQYELGDSKTTYILGNTWNSQHQGLLAGETLQMALAQMESAWYSSRNSRDLEITRTISVKGLSSDQGSHTVDKTTGTYTFSFAESMFHSDYPSHYMRRISSISITLPAAIGPLQTVRAILKQTASTYVSTCDAEGAKAVAQLLKPSSTTPASTSIVQNSNTNQQVALSSGVNDAGLFTLNFGDERYLPFEGTGAASTWSLTFPSPLASDPSSQSLILDSLDDIIVTLHYTARDGGEDFRKSIDDNGTASSANAP